MEVRLNQRNPNPARRLAFALRLLSVLPIVTGAGDLVAGAGLLQQAGLSITREAARDPTLNNQIAFWGTIWLAYGVLLWWTTRQLAERLTIARFLLVTLFMGGLARAYASIRYGLPAPPLIGAMAIELILAPILYAWLNRTGPTGRA